MDNVLIVRYGGHTNQNIRLFLAELMGTFILMVGENLFDFLPYKRVELNLKLKTCSVILYNTPVSREGKKLLQCLMRFGFFLTTQAKYSSELLKSSFCRDSNPTSAFFELKRMFHLY